MPVATLCQLQSVGGMPQSAVNGATSYRMASTRLLLDEISDITVFCHESVRTLTHRPLLQLIQWSCLFFSFLFSVGQSVRLSVSQSLNMRLSE